jgi:cellulose synthase/poly-beta-1,6-N-acetylglucosamine synthase-like glycosyltransferase
MALVARFVAKRTPPAQPARTPSISIIVAVRNEGARIGARIENLLAIEYPGPREILVASDGSTDDTVAVAARFGAAVQVVALPPGGKAAALNAAVARATHEIVVFCRRAPAVRRRRARRNHAAVLGSARRGGNRRTGPRL